MCIWSQCMCFLKSELLLTSVLFDSRKYSLQRVTEDMGRDYATSLSSFSARTRVWAQLWNPKFELALAFDPKLVPLHMASDHCLGIGPRLGVNFGPGPKVRPGPKNLEFCWPCLYTCFVTSLPKLRLNEKNVQCVAVIVYEISQRMSADC